ncbi:hypothetical protein [Clostridium magnum]|uniref:Uncharacterized protein n=1 Tax=Clostridium magnum DSM 2767 TaxID=1121326 RepID=A0A162QLW1_9CLOT|nr:hypothetical protein [Clostridium magnum]KZL88691.1 hypothetical protein CLMAG_59800 [Clostridium magnum DSM 2767]SHJ64277.1 hypothetical protein SAMN02745944_06279 [Clostridium magnum DSM 2767]
MTNKEKFMEYAKNRIRKKDYKRRKLLWDLGDVQAKGIERCANGLWRNGQK